MLKIDFLIGSQNFVICLAGTGFEKIERIYSWQETSCCGCDSRIKVNIECLDYSLLLEKESKRKGQGYL